VIERAARDLAPGRKRVRPARLTGTDRLTISGGVAG